MVLTPKTSKAEFDLFREELAKKISARLQEEAELTIPDGGEEEDLWEVPEVDSKTVIKVSAIIEAHIGIRLPPKLIRAGGYPSIAEAVDDLMQSLRDLCPAVAQDDAVFAS